MADENDSDDSLEDQLRAGDPDAVRQLFLQLYDELRKRARHYMNGDGGITLEPTALVNEAFLKIQQAGGPLTDREHFLRTAARAMRQILVDHFRRRSLTAKDDQADVEVTLDPLAEAYQERAIDLLDLDAILSELERSDPEMAQFIELHFFGGVSTADIAEMTGVSRRTLERRWTVAKRWLHARLDRD
ncbi:MAG: ECF-type sigma factor [Planctomycetota bacterium]